MKEVPIVLVPNDSITWPSHRSCKMPFGRQLPPLSNEVKEEKAKGFDIP